MASDASDVDAALASRGLLATAPKLECMICHLRSTTNLPRFLAGVQRTARISPLKESKSMSVKPRCNAREFTLFASSRDRLS
jgi:hypothetical protein